MSEESNPETTIDQVPSNGKIPQNDLILVLGIASILVSLTGCCCCFGLPVALITGIIAWVMGNKALALYQVDPSAYTLESYNQVKWGRNLAVASLVIAVLGGAIQTLLVFMPQAIPLLDQYQF